MREIRIHIWCDDCLEAHEINTEADRTVTVNVPGVGMRRIDLCEQSDKSLVQPLRDVLAGLASVRPSHEHKVLPKMEGERVKCPLCPETSNNHGSLIKHLWTVHTFNGTPGQPKKCPSCGYENEAPQGMGTHRRLKHNYDAMAEAITQAKHDQRKPMRRPTAPVDQPELAGV